MVRKWPTIDVLKLYSGTLPGFNDEIQYRPQVFSGNDVDANIKADASFKKLKAHTKWNMWLKKCLKNDDLQELMKTRYGLQVGMDDVYKAGLSTPALAEMFIRWTKSIEKTARQIIKKRTKITHAIATDFLKAHEEKRRIDSEFEKFLRESSF
jgi:hypothetical protein